MGETGNGAADRVLAETAIAASRGMGAGARADFHAASAPLAAAVRAARPPATLHATVCTACNSTTEVPFVPDGVRPVYCLPCLKRQTR